MVSALTNGLVGTTNIIITVTPKISLVNVIGNHHSITNGDITPSQSDHTDFGEVGVTTGSQSYVFTVQNTGTLALTVSSINIGDTDNYIFSGLSFPIDIIAGGSEDFNIEFNPTNEGIKNTTVIITNDSAANPYEFSITGEGIKPLMNVIGNSLNITNGATTPSISNHTDFGKVEITTSSQSYDFTIQNTGDIELIISSINVGDTGNYIFSGLSFPATINVGGSTNFNIKFDPATEGIKNTTVIITNDSTATPYKFSITGEGIKLSPNGWTIWWTNRFAGTTAPSILSSGTTDYSSTFSFDDIELCVGTNDILVSALTNGLVGTTNIIITVTPKISLVNVIGNHHSITNGDITPSQSDHTDFGEVGVTTGSQSYVFTVQNTGTLALTVSSINIGDTDNYIFSGLSFPIDIIAGGSEDFNIEFNPTNEGIKNTTVIITNDSAANPYEFSITGEGIKPLMNVIGNSLNITNGATTPSISNHTDFGKVEITTSSQSYDFTIQNTGDIELIISSINVGDTGNYIFSGLSFPATINVGGSTNFNIKFDPATEGIKNTTVIITNDSTATPYKFSITGEGIKLSPNGWTIWWTNRFAGTTAPSILSSGTTDYSSTFSFDDIELCVGTNDILVSALTNGLVGTTNIIITVTPKISLVNVIGNHHSITNGDITPSQSDHTDFGEVGVTTGSQSYVFTVQNTGTLALTVSSINIGDTDNYIFSGLSFPIDIIAGGSEDFNIEFNPTNEGIKNTTVIITNDSAANPYEFSITGEGIKPLMNVIGNSLNITNGATTPSISNHTDFGKVEITTGSQSYDFTIQNTGDIELIISSINVGDTGNYIFSGLSFPATINVGGSTNFNIKFDPATEGIKNTTVIITNDSTATPYKFSITGEGIKLSPNGWTIWWTNRFAGTTAPSILSSGTTDYSSTFSFDDIELCVGTNDILVSALTNGLVGTTNIIITVTPKISLVNVIGNHHSITNGDITPSQSDHTDFGEVGVTTGSQSYVFTIQNTGTLALTVSSINIGDTDNYIFSGLSFPIDIIAGGSEDFNIEFNPTNEGIKNTTVIITNDSAANPYEFSITGEGIKPLMNVIGNSLNITNGATTPSISNHTDFGKVEITTGSQSYDFTIQNTGDIELIISSINVGDTGNYIFSGLSFPATINVGGSTNFNIKFDPATEGIKNTTVIITNDSTATPYKFSITGEGIKLSPNGWTIWKQLRQYYLVEQQTILRHFLLSYDRLVGTTNIIITVTPKISLVNVIGNII